MTNHALRPSQKVMLRQASREPVLTALPRVDRFLNRGQWTGLANVWHNDGQGWTHNRTRSSRQLGDFLAAGSILHLGHAWSFYGRAVACILAGDAERATHFAYYAELRAAISLLATEGIGVMHDDHFAIDENNAVLDIPKSGVRGKLGTHVFVWLALEHWAGLARSAERLGRVITPEGRPLDEWITEFGSGLGMRGAFPVGAQWLRLWGLDIRTMAFDQRRRDQASYRVEISQPATRVGLHEAFQFLEQAWSLCEPSGRLTFVALDRHLLRRALEATHRGRTGRDPLSDPAFQLSVESVVQRTMPHSRHLIDFLNRKSLPDDGPVFRHSSAFAKSGIGGGPLGILARALLMLRVATGAVQTLIFDAGIDLANLTGWLSEMGLNHGLWGDAGEPVEASDSWSDIAVVLQDCTDFFATRGTTASRSEWLLSIPGATSTLSQAERVVVWSIA